MTSCPFCVENGKLSVVAETETAVLVVAKGGDGTAMSGRYLVIPREHIESVLELPEDWQRHVNALLGRIPELWSRFAFNLSYNEGRNAGKRVDHVHCWVIVRHGEEGLPSHTLGMAALLTELNQRSGDLSDKS